MKKLITLFALSVLPAVAEPVALFNGKDFTGWKGEKGYVVKDGVIVCERGRNLYTEKEYKNYSFSFEFKLRPAGNNGIGIHYPGTGIPAYTGIEVQVLDNSSKKYAKIKPTQVHGSLYQLQGAKTGFLKTVGEWNKQTITVNGNELIVELNGTVINKANLDELSKKKSKHQGVKRRSGHICLCGHGPGAQFRNLTIDVLPDSEATDKK